MSADGSFLPFREFRTSYSLVGEDSDLERLPLLVLHGGLPPDLGAEEQENEFFRRHICRLDPQPEVLKRSREQFGKQVYETMWGPNEFTVTGTLQGWDVIDRLGEIRVPALITSGRHDACTPAPVEPLHRGHEGPEWAAI